MYSPLPNQPLNRNVNMMERWLSTIGGGALMTMGLRRRGFLGMLLTGVGGYLAKRGVTGYCAIYQAIGMNTASTAPMRKTDYYPIEAARHNQTDEPLATSSGWNAYEQAADQAEGERQPSDKSTRVGNTPGSAEGDRETVEADLRAKGTS
jgi:hypothetical protein